MKVFTATFLFMLVITNISGILVSTDEIEKLFKNLVRNNLTDVDKQTLEDVFEILYFPNHISRTDEMEAQSQVRLTIECIVCRSAFAALFDGVAQGQSDEQLSTAISVICDSLGIESEEVCWGAVSLNMPILTYIIKNTPGATPQSFCSFVLQTATLDACPSLDDRFEWEVELPPAVSRGQTIPLENDLKPLKIAIFTDSHIDPLYEAFGVANCDAPTCCRVGQRPARKHLTKGIVSDSLIEESLIQDNDKLYLNLEMASKIRKERNLQGARYAHITPLNDAPAGYWGDYRNCDTPLWAFDDAVDAIAERHKDIDIVYFIGDTIDHGIWETTYELIDEMNLYTVEKLRQTFGDNVIVLPVIGNHEAQPTNQFAPAYVTAEKLNVTWLYEALAAKWDYYLSEEAKVQLRQSGDFSILIRPRLRVISINSNVAYRSNWWLVFDPLDAKRHLDWLVEELYKAELEGEYVHIISHIPPGVHDLQQTWTREYNRIVNRFSSTIKAEFNGHLHSDEFRLFYNSNNEPINVAWGAGSVTSYSNYNLNYKIVTVDSNDYEPVDIFNYAYNLTEANLTPNERPHWFLLYDIKQRFGLGDLSAASIHDLVINMVTEKKHLLDIYAAFTSKMSDARWPYCDTNCKLDALCKTVVTVLWSREKCEELRSLYYS